MLTTKLEYGDLKFSNKLIFELISSVIIEIPGVCKLKNYQIINDQKKHKKNIFKNRKGNVITKDAIDIQWNDNKNIYELCLYVILNDLNNIHVIANSIYDRITFEFEKKLKITNLNIKIFIEDFEGAL